jgi:hypothetical protein
MQVEVKLEGKLALGQASEVLKAWGIYCPPAALLHQVPIKNSMAKKCSRKLFI